MATNQFGDVLVSPLVEAAGNPFGDTLVDPIVDEVIAAPQAPQTPQQDQQFQGRQAGYGANDISVLPPLAEIAGGANRSLMYIPDAAAMALTKSISGYAGVLDVIAGKPYTDRTTSISDAIESLSGFRPGQGSSMEEGTAKDVLSAGGEVLVPGAMGLASVAGRNLARPVEAAAEFLGFGSAAPANIARSAVTGEAPLDQIPVGANRTRLDRKVRTELAVKRGEGDIESVGYKLDPEGNVVKDAADNALVNRGWTEGTVAMLKTANKPTRDKVRQMVDMVDRGVRNDRYRDANPPGNIVGKAVNSRLKIIRDAFMTSKDDLDAAAVGLQDMDIDLSGAMNTLVEDLAKQRIFVEVGENGGLILNEAGDVAIDFSKSTIRGADPSMRFVQNLMDYINQTRGDYKAIDAHFAKKFIDESVSYGKQVEGLSGNMQRIAKRLRHNIDTSLDELSPEYDAANTMYADTIRVINGVQDLAGKKVDLLSDSAEEALGTMSRKVLSNYQSGPIMRDAFSEMDATAGKYAEQMGANPSILDDSIPDLISAEAAIRNSVPGVAKAGSLQGIIGAETGKLGLADAAVDVASGSPVGMLRAGVKAVKGATKSDPTSSKAKLRQLEGLRIWLDQVE